MIEGLSLAGPQALLMTQATTPASELASRLRDRVRLAGPETPTGPPPTFDTSPIERLRETRRAEPVLQAAETGLAAIRMTDPQSSDAAMRRIDFFA